MPTVITGTDGVSQVQTGAVEASDLPSEAYQKNNILGTVSESSGVPTGAIIERGSNSNGKFVKYADGTMICFFAGSITTTGSTSVSGVNVSSPVDYTFPVNFVARPATSLSGGRPDTNGFWYVLGSHSSFWRVWALRNVSQATATRDISLAAIGRWY